MRIALIIIILAFHISVAGQTTSDTSNSNVPVIYGERLSSFVDSLKHQVLTDTSKFYQGELIFTAEGRQHTKPYSKLFIINGRYLYKMDIVKPKEVVDFASEIFDYKKIKSITIVDSSKVSTLLGQNARQGVILIAMYDNAKFNPKVAGLKMFNRKTGDNFSQRNKGELLIRN
jgi:hypothetical protein